LPYYQQSATWRLINRIQQSINAHAQAATNIDVEDEAGEGYIERRAQRKNRVIRNTLPDLSAGLDEYSNNLNAIVDIAEAHNVRLILMAQPTFWRPDLTQEEKDLLWFGWGPKRSFFYSIESLADGISAYNQRLLEVCQQRQVECVDLANALPKDTTVFYDDVHFNESGAQRVSKVVADYLLQRFPFSR
jgi:lysophospholipase L1-like esterase